ncbi:MAG: D-alanyl-D-alanine carboxypeptidase/D-alanyl-D-alanine-endopeptidase [Opitutus sp.]|nr:D-alanyl-D-alanine carboxypeptidase/D-alanyl-D-alanine-endopeptidase [Opitutus sp.]
MTAHPRLLLWLVVLLCTPLLRAAAFEERLGQFLAQPKFEGAMWAVKMVSLDDGRVLFEHQPKLRMSPASNAKLYVGALALARLGSDYRIRTPLLATAAVQPDGTLPGDLVVAGRGDPSWGAREKKPEFWSVFDPFVAALRRAGVKHIRGDIVADGTWLRTSPDGGSWTVDDMQQDFGAEISGVTFLDNYVEIRVTPGAQPGEPCAFEVLEPHSGLTFVNRTKTLPAGAKSTVDTRRIYGTRTVEIFGGVALGAKPEITEAPVPRPAQWFAVCLKAALERAGIRVDGSARSTVWPEPPVDAGVALGEIVSPPLRDLVAGFMKPSQNLETDLVFAHVGELQRTDATAADERSDDLALADLKRFAAGIGIAPNELIIDEGSGLSRNNLVTADATVRLLAFMAGHREADAFIASLPTAGEGTLAKRFKGTPAEHNVRAKTGGLRWAATLSGYLTTTSGERAAFSVMLNRHVASAGTRASQEVDAVTVLLTQYERN